MKKILTSFVLFFIFVFSLPNAHSYASPENEEQHVKNFYIWYIKERINQKYPIEYDAIYKYVYPCTVSNIRLGNIKGFRDADYFTKSQDVWKEWLDVLEIHSATKIDETISIVPISFKWTKDNQRHLIVFVKNEKGALCITKVVSADGFRE